MSKKLEPPREQEDLYAGVMLIVGWLCGFPMGAAVVGILVAVL